MRAVLISTYDMGRQPFGLASPAAWLRDAGFEVTCADLSREQLSDEAIRQADFVAFFLPMHTATRLAMPVIDRVRALNPAARLCAYGLYAPLNESLLREHGVSEVLGGEFEEDLLTIASAPGGGFDTPDRGGRLNTPDRGGRFNTPDLKVGPTRTGSTRTGCTPTGCTPTGSTRTGSTPTGSTRTPRIVFRVPDRKGLPDLSRYATLQTGAERRTVGYTEASRGCKHRCRHCPIVPVYDGRFRIVPVDVVIADVRAQVAAGARHVTFGDPDFFNGIGHARAVVEAFGRQFPDVSYDVTIKVEHLLEHAGLLRLLRETGCAFVTSAVESVDDRVLAYLEKGHTRADFERIVALFEEAGLALAPTFVAFTPWTTLAGYCELLQAIDRLRLVDNVSPIQLAIRLLITEGSRLLELHDIRRLTDAFDPRSLTYPWRHPDPRVDRLQEEIAALAGVRLSVSRREVFARIRESAHAAAGLRPPDRPDDLLPRAAVPYLNEPWYC